MNQRRGVNITFPSEEVRDLFIKWLDTNGFNDFSGFHYDETSGPVVILNFNKRDVMRDGGTLTIIVQEEQV